MLPTNSKSLAIVASVLWCHVEPRWPRVSLLPTEHRYCQSCLIGAFKVQHDAALATLQYGIGGMPPVGPARWVDADDLGALIGQQQCRQWPSEIPARNR